MEKVLTISIAAYNIENYIEQALNSLLDARINDRVEILVCDDGGRDHTLAIAEVYASKYPNTVFPIHKENGGYGSVLNTTVARATGKYYKVLDGDDWYIKENFVRFVDLLSQIDVDYVISDMCNFYESSGCYIRNSVCEYVPEGKYEFDQVEFRDLIGMSTSAFRTSILKALPKPFTEHCFYTDNELVNYSVPYFNSVYFWHHPLYVYRHGRAEASMSKSGMKKHYKEQESVFWRMLEVYQGLDEGATAKRQFVKNRLIKEIRSQFVFLCVFKPSKTNYQEMCAFRDRVRKECPEVLSQAAKTSRTVKYFLRYGKSIYPFLHSMRSISEWKADQKRKRNREGNAVEPT